MAANCRDALKAELRIPVLLGLARYWHYRQCPINLAIARDELWLTGAVHMREILDLSP